MLPVERRAAWSLALIYMVRMLGLFIILPVFALFADEYAHSTPFLIGLALGTYGLLQAILQIPFGRLSDRIGRKKTITIGLLLFFFGSVVAALADSIYMVIVGRALQGAGAIAAALMALAADLSRDEQRTKMMATLGASIGLSFLIALLLGPLLITHYSIDMLFWFSAFTALVAIAMLYTVVPDPAVSGYSADTSANVATVTQLLRHTQLLRLDISIFLLHLIITAMFVAVPLLLRDSGVVKGDHWLVYGGAMLVSILFMVPMLIVAERYRKMRLVLLLCVLGMLLTQLLFAAAAPVKLALFIGVTLFFCFLNTLESLLPSLLSRIAPAGSRGSANGVYASSQFLGAFVGGAGGGWLLGVGGYQMLYLSLAGLCVMWLCVLAGFKAPRRLTVQRRPLSASELARGDSLLVEFCDLPGVEEAAIAHGVAYLKVDKSLYQQAQE